MADIALLQQVLIAAALGAFIGIERERAPERKFAGLRTLTIFAAGGPLAVTIAARSGSVVPVAMYLLIGAFMSLLIVYIRMQVQGEDVGLTTSAAVFLISMIGLLVGYGEQFTAVAVTLITVLLLTEKDVLHRYTNALEEEELSDAIKLGILALVLYPILPGGAVDPYGVLFLRKALLFVIFILLIQFAGYASLKWLGDRASFLLSAGLGGVASSLATVTTMAQHVKDHDLTTAAYAGAIAAVVASFTRNLFITAALVPAAAAFLYVPFGVAIVIATGAVLYYYRETDQTINIAFDAGSPFSFRSAFKFGAMFLAILMASEITQLYLPDSGIFLTAVIGGIGSSTAVVASAATLLDAGTVSAHHAAIMIALGATGSLLSKLFYTVVAGAPTLTRKIAIPYILMSGAALLVAVL